MNIIILLLIIITTTLMQFQLLDYVRLFKACHI